MADDIRRWSDELAENPDSTAFIPLAEALRRQGQLDVAAKVAMRGLHRHAHNPEGHDLLARIQADRGDLQAAFDEWDMVLRLAPGHVGAIKGMAFVRFQQGEHAEAERLLVQAQQTDGTNEVSAAIATVRRSTSIAIPAEARDEALPADPHQLFVDLLSGDQSAMLLSRDGLVIGGAYYSSNGHDVAQDVGASLSGVSEEAFRATRHLGIGDWRSIIFETERAVVSLAPAPMGGSMGDGGLLVVAGAPATPLGLLRRLLDRCLERVVAWIGAGRTGAGGGAR